jgi:hypothetical protein
LAIFALTSSDCIPLPSDFESDCSSDGEGEFKPSTNPGGPYSFLKTPRYAMELIRSDVSSNVGASLANAVLLDLQAMDLLKPGLDTQQIIIDKSVTLPSQWNQRMQVART